MYNHLFTFLFCIFIAGFAFDVIESLCSVVQINFRIKKGAGNDLSLPRKWKLF